MLFLIAVPEMNEFMYENEKKIDEEEKKEEIIDEKANLIKNADSEKMEA